jgi:DNA-binding MarR family transcriptional regulator
LTTAFKRCIHTSVADRKALKILCNEVGQNCACQGVRRSARTITQLYDHALAPVGLKATQLPILVALELHGPVPLSPVAEGLVMDRTTLTRNLRALQAKNFVTVSSGSDRRVRLLALTRQGRKLLAEALKLWKVAQAEVKTSFGDERLDDLLGELSALTQRIRT